MTELLTNQKLKNAEAEGDARSGPLLEILSGATESHMPLNAVKIGTSVNGHLVPDLEGYMNEK